MKKLVLIHVVMLFCFQQADGQCQRKSLLEKFTSETCPPDLPTNLALKVVTDANKGKVVVIGWHTPIPSVSSNSNCPYKQNKTENDWRYKPSPAGYGYPSQNTPTTPTVNGINSSPTCRVDGQHLWVFGAPGDHTAYVNTTYLDSARSISSPFCLVMDAAWNLQCTALNVSVTITATQNFTASGALRFRLVMTEELHYATAPGTNKEKDFYDVARASFPDLMSGTLLDTVWVNGDFKSFVISCPTTSTVVDKSLLNMVGFIQDDGNKKVLQAEETSRVPLQNDVSIVQVVALPMQCDTLLLSTVTLTNIGASTVNSFKLSTQVDNYPISSTNFSMTMAPGSSVAVQPPLVAASVGAHNYLVKIDSVNGQSDLNSVKNAHTVRFQVFSPPTTERLFETFETATFPPTGWQVTNVPFGKNSWQHVPWPGGYASDTGCARFPFLNVGYPGQTDALYLPPFSLASSTKHSISFDVAYAQYTSTSKDTLKLQISDDCGITWTTLSSKCGSLLATAVPSLTAFRPGASEWRTEKINLTAFTGKPNLIMRFVAISDYGNDLFLDNINFSTTTGIHESVASEGLLLFPNPASEGLNIEFLQGSGLGFDIEISTLTGQIIYKFKNPTALNSQYIDTSNWEEGIYLFRAHDGDRCFVGKVVVRR